MPRIEREKRFQIGDFWLSAPTRKYPYWRVCWYDAIAEQTRGVPARPEDDPKGHIRDAGPESVAAAKLALIAFEAENRRTLKRKKGVSAEVHEVLARADSATPESVDALVNRESARVRNPKAKKQGAPDLSLCTVMLHYKLYLEKKPAYRMKEVPDELKSRAEEKNRRKAKRRAKRVPKALRIAVEVWGDPMCSDLDEDAQHEFINHARAKGLADDTIVTYLDTYWAAMRRAAKKDKILRKDAIPDRLDTKQWEPPAKLRRRHVTLEIEEIGRLFDAAGKWETPHAWQLLFGNTETVARPMSFAEVLPEQVVHKYRNIDLLEPGEIETKKQKAVLRCTPTFWGWLELWLAAPKAPGDDPEIVTYKGKRIRTTGWFSKLAKQACVDIPSSAGAYSLRHAIAAILHVEYGLTLEEIGAVLAHGAETNTAGYIHPSKLPGFMARAVAAKQDLFRRIAAHVKSRPLLIPHEWDKIPEGWNVPPPEPELPEQPQPIPEMDCFMERFRATASRFITPSWQLRGNIIGIQVKNETLSDADGVLRPDSDQ